MFVMPREGMVEQEHALLLEPNLDYNTIPHFIPLPSAHSNKKQQVKTEILEK